VTNFLSFVYNVGYNSYNYDKKGVGLIIFKRVHGSAVGSFIYRRQTLLNVLIMIAG